MAGEVIASGLTPDTVGALARLGFDLCAVAVLAGVYFLRYLRKDLAAVFALFNVCLLVVVTVIQFANVGASVGFGLFAILSIIRLRSEPFRNIELGYFLAALVLGVLNGVGMPSLAFTAGFDVLIVLAAFVLDHPRVIPAGERVRVTLDVVETDRTALRALLADRLGGTVIEFAVASVDYIRDSMEVDATFRATDGAPVEAARRWFAPRRRLELAQRPVSDRDRVFVRR